MNGGQQSNKDGAGVGAGAPANAARPAALKQSGPQVQQADAPSMTGAAGGSANGGNDTAATTTSAAAVAAAAINKKRKKEGLKPIITTEKPHSSGYVPYCAISL